MFLYNVHTPSKTFALTHKEGESYNSLLERVTHKAGLEASQTKALKNHKDGGLVYEYQGEKYSLEDDDDLEILLSRLPPSSTSSTTLHLSVPSAANSQPHAHFAPSPPSYSTAADTIKSKAQRSQSQASNGSSKPQANGNGNGLQSAMKSPKSHDYAPSGPRPKAPGSTVGPTSDSNPLPARGWRPKEGESENGDKDTEHTADGTSVNLFKPPPRRPQSVASTRSRRSRYGGDPDAEPWVDVHKRKWEAFQNGTGVRTVVGEIAGVPNVRMLFKGGYKGVYISRTFALKTGIVSPKFGMGSMGYTGLKALGNVTIKVGSKTATHPAFISEEQHFDVVLGRQWSEKVGIKVDPIDQTMLTYMDSGEVIPCDIVVLKDEQGNKILVT